MTLSELHRAVVFNQANGRIIWQPRIQCWYSDKIFAGEELPEPYRGMELLDIYRQLGCSPRPYRQFNPCYRKIPPESVRTEDVKLGDRKLETTVYTPVGNLRAITQGSPNSPARHWLKWLVTEEEDLRVATWLEENTTWEWDEDAYRGGLEEIGDLAAPCAYLPRSNVQDLYLNLMGVENGVYAIYDWTDTVEKYFAAQEENHHRLIDVVCDSPIEIINFGENIHSGTLPPDLFEKYHLPVCQRRCEKLRAAGKFTHSHWDGDCKPLLPYLKDTGLHGVEAITPSPQGDVTLAELRQHLGGEQFLLDGIPAILFNPEYSVTQLRDCVRELLDLFAPRLVLGISDELSSFGDIERVRMVGEWVREWGY